MIHIRDFLNRIMWDSRMCKEEYDIFYYDRVCKSLKRIPFTDIKCITENFIELKDGADIPLHRIREIRRNSKLVWERRRQDA